MLTAIAGGFGSAVMFAAATMAASRASRLIGASSTLAWVAILGLAIAAIVVTFEAPVPSATQVPWLAIAGFGNVGGLLLVYLGVRSAKVGVVAPIASTEGAVTALLAVVAGERLSVLELVSLAIAVAGVVLVARPSPDDAERKSRLAAGSVFGVGAALLFGLSLYAAGRVSSLPVGWIVMPSRLVGVAFVAIPLMFARRLRLTQAAIPLVGTAAACEVLGFVSFALGARHGIAPAAVLSSLYAALAAVGAYFLFSERLGPTAAVGIMSITIGVALLTAMQ